MGHIVNNADAALRLSRIFLLDGFISLVNYNINVNNIACVPLGMNGKVVPVQRVACEVTKESNNTGSVEEVTG